MVERKGKKINMVEEGERVVSCGACDRRCVSSAVHICESGVKGLLKKVAGLYSEGQ